MNTTEPERSAPRRSTMSRYCCFVPKVTNCSDYRESDISATLITKYHYGGGGDAALILEKKDAEVTAAGFKGHMGGKAHGIGYVDGGAQTIVAGQETHVVICFEPGIAKREGGQTDS